MDITLQIYIDGIWLILINRRNPPADEKQPSIRKKEQGGGTNTTALTQS